jgi:acylpyruvate hydrolase
VRIVTFATDGQARLGAAVDDVVIDLPGTFAVWQRTQATAAAKASSLALPTNTLEFLQVGQPAREAASHALAFAADGDNLAALTRIGLAYPTAEVEFLPPISRPGKIICLGLNYRHHIIEMGRELPKYPVIFAKFANTLIGHRQPIVLPPVSKKVDYEAEMVIVIGRTGKNVSPEAAFDYIAGYTIFNDVSARDYQRRTIQWLQGKTFDGSGPIGPALVTADEISAPHALDITLRLNGEVMQQSNTADFIFDIPTIIHYLSQIMTLEPGDLIATGTPSGVGFARDPQVFLKPGDVVQVEISELGVLENPVVKPESDE